MTIYKEKEGLTRYGSGTAAETRRSQTYEAQVNKMGSLTAHLGRLLPPLLDGIPLKSNVQTPVPRTTTKGPRGVASSPAMVTTEKDCQFEKETNKNAIQLLVKTKRKRKRGLHRRPVAALCGQS